MCAVLRSEEFVFSVFLNCLNFQWMNKKVEVAYQLQLHPQPQAPIRFAALQCNK